MKIKPNCLSCYRFRPEEIGDSDFGHTYTKESSCSEYLDTDPETEEDIPDFDREQERDCCVFDFWQVLDQDDDLNQMFLKEMEKKDGKHFDKTYEVFKKRYEKYL